MTPLSYNSSIAMNSPARYRQTTQNMQLSCRGLAKTQNRTPTLGEKQKKMCFPPNVGAQFPMFATPPE